MPNHLTIGGNMAELILIRHGESLWNAANRFTGWVDVPLSERGRAEATIAACKLRQYRIDVCFTSLLLRAVETAVICLTKCPVICHGRVPIIKHDADDPDWHGWDKYEGNLEEELPIFTSAALDERYYGKLQGLNKQAVMEQFGKTQVQQWSRSFSERPPGGESLEDTMKRTMAFFRDRILRHLTQGDNVLLVAHGNSLRSIVMELDNLAPEDAPRLDVKTGVPIIYQFNPTGQPTQKTILND